MRAQVLAWYHNVPEAVSCALFIRGEVGVSPFASLPFSSPPQCSAGQQAGEAGDKAPSSV